MNLLPQVRSDISASPFAWAFFCLTLLLHIIWPLADGSAQATITTLAVITLAISSWFSALRSIGATQSCTMFFVVSLVALAVEHVGFTISIPFGNYVYTEKLQPQVFGVPLAVVLAWFAMTWFMCSVVRDTRVPRYAQSVLAGLLLTTWDFFLDPQMTAVGYWIWGTTSPDLPGIPGIPLSNYLGWFASGTALSFIVLSIAKSAHISRTLADAVLLWTAAGGFILHAIFWKNVSVGLWGLVSMATLWFFIRKLSDTT